WKNKNEVKYAGAFSRLIAYTLDMLILIVPLSVLSNIFGEDKTITIVLSIILWWIYTSYSIFKWQGTLGKRIVGLYVLGIDLEALSFKRASLRYLFSLISYLPIVVYLILSTYIDMGVSNLIWMILFLILIPMPLLMMFFNTKRKTLYDYWADTVVIESITNIIPEPTTLQKTIRVIMGIIILIPIAYGIFYVVMMYLAFGGQGQSSDTSITLNTGQEITHAK
ncbi:MAG: RDD family protein, partial [Sulfurovum sp.]|nr:RDD family protein [Sulfurovum sp.]